MSIQRANALRAAARRHEQRLVAEELREQMRGVVRHKAVAERLGMTPSRFGTLMAGTVIWPAGAWSFRIAVERAITALQREAA